MKSVERALKTLALGFFRLFFGREMLAEIPVHLKKPERILAVRSDARMGNLVFTLPFLTVLRKRFPAAKISFLTSAQFAELLKGETFVDEVLAYDKKKVWHPFYFFGLTSSLRKRRFDWCFDLGSPQSPSFTNSFLCAVAEAPVRIAYRNKYSEVFDNLTFEPAKDMALYEILLGLLNENSKVQAAASGPFLNLDSCEREVAMNFFSGVHRPRVGLFVGGRGEKKWELGRWLEVAEKLLMNGCYVCLFYGPDEADEVEKGKLPGGIRLVPPRPLRQFCAIVSELDLFVSVDTGPLHLASAIEVPVVGLYFDSDAQRFTPIGKRKIIIQREKDKLEADFVATTAIGFMRETSKSNPTVAEPAKEKVG